MAKIVSKPRARPKKTAKPGRVQARAQQSGKRGTPAKAAAKAKPAPKAAGKTARWVYGFGGGKAEGTAKMRDLLGGKGAGLAEMANLGLPVPPGFTITTEVCTHYYKSDKTYPKELEKQVMAALAQV